MTRNDINIFSIAAGSAAVLGLGLGAWSAPPSYMAEPSRAADAKVVDQIDPNLARYRQMLETEGVDPIPRVVVAGFYPAPQAPLPQEAVVTAAYNPDDDVTRDGDSEVGRPIAIADTAAADRPAPARSYTLAYRTYGDAPAAVAPAAAVQPPAEAVAAPQAYAAPQPAQAGEDPAAAPSFRPSSAPQGG